MDNRDRITMLLAERATEGLDAARRSELERLLAEHPEWADDTFELAAAAIDEALAGPTEPLPDHLRARLKATAAGFAATSSSTHPGLPAPGADVTPDRVVQLRLRRSLGASVGWLAAAAALILAVLSWWPGAAPVNAPPTAAALRAELLAEATDALVLDWAATADPAASGAAGDVVWSPSRQTGFMRITGLEVNDPARQQYQLWIFDAARDERFPVDGGVFDVPADDGEIVIPIDTSLPVDTATLFAVTVEPPGGVVVSNRERIVLVASGAD